MFTFVAQTISQMINKTTLAAISERTGYSVSTISRVLSGNAEKYRISQSAKVCAPASRRPWGLWSPVSTTPFSQLFQV